MPSKSAPRSALRDFLESESAGGMLLIFAAILAMIVANSAFGETYLHFIHAETGPVLTDKLGPMTVHLWINDGLMAVFFLLVGLEIKREFVDGRLASWDRRRLPFIAAAAGMAVPAALYMLFAGGTPGLAQGWAIPAATDIAFAIGVLALLGKRAPTSLKLFLVTVAIVDDMGAVAIIALFYTAKINVAALAAAAAIVGAMFACNRLGVRSLIVYLLMFVLLWYAMLLSGVHATIAGVLAAMTIPFDRTPGAPDSATSPLHRLEHGLHPWVAFAIVPLFGFANAGVDMSGLTADQIFAPLPLGIAAGLFLGKQIGIFGSVWLSVKFGIAGKLRGATWPQIYGVSLLCGIGFTMSLFIGGLAFPGDATLIEEAKIGILMGSLVAALAGFAVLRFTPLHPEHDRIETESDVEIASDGDVNDTCEPEGRMNA
ncbi:Na+/H+ antiporter NhaA [Sphingopyxis macrogoltabida]|uniref:Na(+)/H(+) antiporter NhaA n=1 Tax=Sphingopyxis macrogoltabida TaxID=33050 RepID=A0AAC9FGA8_SPHMC|nr:Na+/H+ antiporter NhaA [Sphingopyxis macrogoltabida]ALJ15035.1 pH-dependent sodium/proton antiporter [Sphingopyxis macrogoltabida]AMU91283.1 sodium:proton antiporter [Sphingopyxis macrogoltabida]